MSMHQKSYDAVCQEDDRYSSFDVEIPINIADRKTRTSYFWKFFFLAIILSPSLLLLHDLTKRTLSREEIKVDARLVARNDFDKFCKHHGLRFSDGEEYEMRLEVFNRNIAIANSLNQLEPKRGGTAIYGETKFSYLSPDEFKTIYSGTKLPQGGFIMKRGTFSYSGNPLNFSNWAGILTTPVKNQGYCGCCWAVAATEQLESDAMRLGIKSIGVNSPLSVQQLVDCDTIDAGCSGGWFEYAYRWIARSGGIGFEVDYPFTAEDSGLESTCSYNKADSILSVSFDSYTQSYALGFASELDIASFVLNSGPVHVVIDSTPFQNYISGVISSCDPVNYVLDHAVQIVGLNLPQKYWIIRNSFGVGFGQMGYAYLQFGSDMCGVADYAHITQPMSIPNNRTARPTSPSVSPTAMPSRRPSTRPSKKPSTSPRMKPTAKPTVRPSTKPTS